jgi:MinD superfamily P-loop ATPase
MAVLITEPTPSGRHDLERIAELCDHFQIPAGVIVNKFDLSKDNTRKIESFCVTKGLKHLGRLPHDRAITEAMVAGQTITEYQNNGLSRDVKKIWSNIQASINI